MKVLYKVEAIMTHVLINLEYPHNFAFMPYVSPTVKM